MLGVFQMPLHQRKLLRSFRVIPTSLWVRDSVQLLDLKMLLFHHILTSMPAPSRKTHSQNTTHCPPLFTVNMMLSGQSAELHLKWSRSFAQKHGRLTQFTF